MLQRSVTRQCFFPDRETIGETIDGLLQILAGATAASATGQHTHMMYHNLNTDPEDASTPSGTLQPSKRRSNPAAPYSIVLNQLPVL